MGTVETRHLDGDVEVLEFILDDKQYCVDLALVDEIVNNDDTITEIPNSDPEVVGVMDLRGQTTTIVDPRIALELPRGSDPKYIIVFDSDERPIGWLIEDVTQVSSLPEEHLDETVSNDAVKGVFKHGEEFTIWVEPAAINT